MTVRIQLRRDTEANWIAANPILAEGEAAFSLDKNQVKIGDGTKIWSSLEYLGAEDKTPELIALINKNTQDIAAETAARQSGDATLSGRITDEAAARTEADNELSIRIQSLEDNPSVPDGLIEQVGNNTEAINNQAQAIQDNTTAINNQADAIATNVENIGKLDGRVETLEGTKYVPLPNGILEQFNDTDYLLIGRTDPNTGTTPTYLATWAAIKQQLGIDNTPPGESGFGTYEFMGETWWGQPAQGELWLNFGENQIYLSKTDRESEDKTEEIRNLGKGDHLVLKGANGFARFNIKSKASFASGENGDYYVINVREDYIEGDIKINDVIYLIREPKSEDDNFGLEAHPAGDPRQAYPSTKQASVPTEELEELNNTVAKIKKELITLKGQVTRLKNGTNKP